MPVIRLVMISRPNTSMPSIFHWYCKCTETHMFIPDGTVKDIRGFVAGYLWLRRIASKYKFQPQNWEHSFCFTSAETKQVCRGVHGIADLEKCPVRILKDEAPTETMFGASMVKLSRCGTSVFNGLPYTNPKRGTSAGQHKTVSCYEHAGRLAGKVCSLSLRVMPFSISMFRNLVQRFK